jgi:hypothetical protein
MNKVIITTCVIDMSMLETSLLTLKSIRVGFPNWEIEVVDNASIEPAIPEIIKRTKAVGAKLKRIRSRVEHSEVFETELTRSRGQIVFLDSDLIFYDNCENWRFDMGLAGRVIAERWGYYTKCVSVERIHTSFLWINTEVLRDQMSKLPQNLEYAPNYFWKPQLVYFAGKRRFYDTGAMLYQAVGGVSFSEKQLDAFTHIYHGSFMPTTALPLLSDFPEDKINKITMVHKLAITNPEQLKGLWRRQDLARRTMSEKNLS